MTVWLTDYAGESAVFPGIARLDGSTLFLDRTSGAPFEIHAEWHERIRAVPNDEVKQILQGADYFLRLFVGCCSEEKGAKEYEPTGLKWPE